MALTIMNSRLAIVYLYVYILAWPSRWLDYDIMVVICRNQWEFMFFGMIPNVGSTRPVLLLISHGEMHELQQWKPRSFTWNDSNANISCMTVTLIIPEIYTCIREHKQQ